MKHEKAGATQFFLRCLSFSFLYIIDCFQFFHYLYHLLSIRRLRYYYGLPMVSERQVCDCNSFPCEIDIAVLRDVGYLSHCVYVPLCVFGVEYVCMILLGS